jgi:hypothetical protein
MNEPNVKSHECNCGSGKISEWIYDGYNIPLTKCCSSCKKEKLGKFRTDIMSQYDAYEPIEPEF